MAPVEQDEVERKYEVTLSAVLPDLRAPDGVVAVGEPVVHELEAVYFDTPGLDLARHRVTLRRRTGGQDAGWHVKLPGQADTRTEVRMPLGDSDGEDVPSQLVEPVRALVRDRRLEPVVRICTRRREHRLLGEGDRVLAVVCDDAVHAQRLVGDAGAQQWREWEVELVDGERAVLEAVHPRLLTAGAKPASVSSKLARALGDALPAPVEKPSAAEVARGSTAGLLRFLLTEQVAQLHQQDARLRSGASDAVHKLRIAARRLRSTLTTYRAVLDRDAAGQVREQLRWLGQTLSEARDAQVLGEHLEAMLAGQPPELVVGPVLERVTDGLDATYHAGVEHAKQELTGERYFRLLDALDDLLTSLPVTAEANTPARQLAARLLQQDAQRLRRAVSEVDTAQDPQERDLALHEARKKAKRLRYGAESVLPVFGRKARTLARAAERVQESLGIYQDSVVARAKLGEYAEQAHHDAEDTFTYGRLHALEEWRAHRAEHTFASAWADLPSKNLNDWLAR